MFNIRWVDEEVYVDRGLQSRFFVGKGSKGRTLEEDEWHRSRCKIVPQLKGFSGHAKTISGNFPSVGRERVSNPGGYCGCVWRDGVPKQALYAMEAREFEDLAPIEVA